MKLIESEVIIKEQEPGIDGIYKQIEWAGRHCYKSHDKITEDSAKEFVDRMINSKHGAMLEHGTVYLKYTAKYDNEKESWDIPQHFPPFLFERNKYSIVRKLESTNECVWFVTTNLRAIVELQLNDWEEYSCEPEDMHERRITARFTCDMGVGREIIRHRTMSFAQESTRYCNYSKSKFGNELTFVIPTWLDRLCTDDAYGIIQVGNGYDPRYIFCSTCQRIEEEYMKLIELGHKPQEARQLLPLGLKTEIVVTGFESDWKHFFELRTASNAHPDMRKLALELEEKLNNVNK